MVKLCRIDTFSLFGNLDLEISPKKRGIGSNEDRYQKMGEGG